MKEGIIVQNRYEIIRKIGEGGMGKVYLVRDLKLMNKYWALKEIGGDGFHEVGMLAQLSHPFLPHIADYFYDEQSGSTVIIMEYIEGETLASMQEKKGGILTEAEVLKYSIQLCELLVYLHSESIYGIIYRDLKPENIIIDPHHCARLVDFGTARVYKKNRTSDTERLGTIGYASPEQLEGMQTDQRSDLYSLGMLMYHLLTNGWYAGHRNNTRKWNISPILHSVLSKAMHVERSLRFQTATEMKEQLLQCERALTRKVTKGVYSNKRGQYEITLIGNLYAGAGATSCTFKMARDLQKNRLFVVELPSEDAEHLSIIRREVKLPSKYQYWHERNNTNFKQINELKVKQVTFFPANPIQIGYAEDFIVGDWLYTLTGNKMIIDVSNHWDHPLFEQWLYYAKEIFLVLTPEKTKLQRPRSSLLIDRFLNDKSFNHIKISTILNKVSEPKKQILLAQSTPFPLHAIVKDLKND